MVKLLEILWDGWKKVGMLIGNLISGLVLVIFYFTIFALFAIPFRILSNPLGRKALNSNWMPRVKTSLGLEDFKEEF